MVVVSNLIGGISLTLVVIIVIKLLQRVLKKKESFAQLKGIAQGLSHFLVGHSAEIQISPIVPYQPRMKLGWTVDKKDLRQGSLFIKGEIKTETKKINNVSAQFSFPSSLEDVCQVLEIDFDYAMKVEAGLIKNDVVESCLEHLYSKICFIAIFRVCYTYEETKIINSQDDIDTNSKSGLTQTHFIRSISNGNELVVIMKLSSDTDARTELKECLFGNFEDNFYHLDDATLKQLEKCIDGLEKHLKINRNAKCKIVYGGTFKQLDRYTNTNTGTGMLQVIKHFKKECDRYQEYCISDVPVVIKDDASVKLEIGRKVKSDSKEQETKEMLDVSSEQFALHNIRANLEQISGNEDKRRQQKSARLHEYLWKMKTARTMYLNFSKNRDMHPDHDKEGKKIFKYLEKQLKRTVYFTKWVDWSNSSCNYTLPQLGDPDLLKKVTDFIETVTTKLPPGKDKVMMVIGKTGNGKSATSNLIVGHEEFTASSNQESVTKESKLVQESVDGRALKIVDTPGVCDTSAKSENDSLEMAIGGISQAITQCAEGFDALLMVIRYGVRMTEEEKNAVKQLKSILGEHVIKTHCIIVITFRDNYVKVHGSLDFMDWCKDQTGFLGDLFKEADYRCVLIDNSTHDDQEKKSMVIDLITMVDKIQTERYTNKWFQYAFNERKIQLAMKEWAGLDFTLMNEVLRYEERLSKLNTRSIEDLNEYKKGIENLQNKITKLIKPTSLWGKFKHIFSPAQHKLKTEEDTSDFIQKQVAEITAMKEDLQKINKDIDDTVKDKLKRELLNDRAKREAASQSKGEPKEKSSCAIS